MSKNAEWTGKNSEWTGKEPEGMGKSPEWAGAHLTHPTHLSSNRNIPPCNHAYLFCFIRLWRGAQNGVFIKPARAVCNFGHCNLYFVCNL